MGNTISLDLAKDNINNPSFFEGGVTVEKDGEPALFIMTAKEQNALFNELHERQRKRRADETGRFISARHCRG